MRRPKALGLPIVCGIFVLGALAANEGGNFRHPEKQGRHR